MFKYNDEYYYFRLLLGSVNHALKFGTSEVVVCQPIPLEASCHIADHIQVNIYKSDIRPNIYLNFYFLTSNWAKVKAGASRTMKKIIFVSSWSGQDW